jgi:beta-aspartyl-peptidase (threonine type)
MRCLLAVGSFLLCLALFSFPVAADEESGWLFDSLNHNPSAANPDVQQIYDVLLKLFDRWNAHDIDGYLSVYWNSPDLLVVVDSEEYNGWQQLRDSYRNAYPNRDSMGHITPTRIQIKLLKPELGLALIWWSMSFPHSKQNVVGNSTMNLEKFDDGWKIVASHSSTAEM